MYLVVKPIDMYVYVYSTSARIRVSSLESNLHLKFHLHSRSTTNIAIVYVKYCIGISDISAVIARVKYTYNYTLRSDYKLGLNFKRGFVQTY